MNFAQAKNPASEMNSVARGRLGEDGALAGHQITASNTDELHKLSRSAADKTANDRTREIFKNAIIEMFGGEAKIPAADVSPARRHFRGGTDSKNSVG